MESSDNQQLKQERKNPNVLFPGDVVFVPERRAKEEDGTTEAKHRFRKKGLLSKVTLVLKDEDGNPRADADYSIEINGQWYSGKTNSQGELEQAIPPDVRKGKLVVHSDGEELDLKFGSLDPVSEMSGVQARLNNLGFFCEVSGTLDEHTHEAILAFQEVHGLRATGELDDSTRQQLEQEHGS